MGSIHIGWLVLLLMIPHLAYACPITDEDTFPISQKAIRREYKQPLLGLYQSLIAPDIRLYTTDLGLQHATQKVIVELNLAQEAFISKYSFSKKFDFRYTDEAPNVIILYGYTERMVGSHYAGIAYPGNNGCTIIINKQEVSYMKSYGDYILLNVIKHEILHCLGLDHNGEPDDILNPKTPLAPRLVVDGLIMTRTNCFSTLNFYAIYTRNEILSDEIPYEMLCS